MKKILLAAALTICGFIASAQQYDVIDQVRSDWRKLAAMEGIHRFDWAADGPESMNDRSIPEFSKAPKGYKPFYISHYGRHGSRYAWSRETYTYLKDVFTDAHNAGVLTEIGEEFYRKYIDFYQLPCINTGDLTELGFLQHRRLGRYACDAFPEVFCSSPGRKAPKVEARSSTSQRCIVSMAGFCQGMQAEAPWLDITQASTQVEMANIVPSSASKELQREFKGYKGEIKLMDAGKFRHSIVDHDGIIARIFTDPDFIKGYEGKRTRFLNQMFMFLGGYRNYCEEPIFDGVITTEQMLQLWEAKNYSSFYRCINSQYKQIPVLEDIIGKASEVIAGNRSDKAADLRFGHDYILEALLFLLNADRCGTIPATEAEVKYWFQNYNIQMATTIMFVLYRGKSPDDVLFKFIWNEKEASLPQLEPVEGHYYRWSDFVQWAEALIAEHSI